MLRHCISLKELGLIAGACCAGVDTESAPPSNKSSETQSKKPVSSHESKTLNKDRHSLSRDLATGR
jgi:hypothetical protein